MRIRRAKYDRLMAEPGGGAYPVSVARTDSLAEVRERFPDLPPGAETGAVVGVSGRVILSRNTGKLCFATLRDDGTELQVMLSAAQVGAESLAAWKADVDLGDIVFVHGEVIASKRGELSVLADSWRMAAKALRPLPVAHKPMSEEARVRQRYVDLIVRPDARRMVLARATVTRSLRETLHRLGYVELETPVLQSLHGGAAARPFRTHLNAFDLEMSLRIATELYLKRAIVGGIDKVYEIGRIFRNEGVDSSHSPEFTSLEAYESYGDYDTMAALTKKMVTDAARAMGVTEIYSADGTAIDLFGEWKSITVHEAVSAAVEEVVTADTSVERLREIAEAFDVPCSRTGMPAQSCSNCTRNWSSTLLFNPHSSVTIPCRSGRWRVRTGTTRGWQRRGT